jgi:hypothetical protein
LRKQGIVIEAQSGAAVANAAGRYTLDNMVGNVAEGIRRCLRTQDGAPLVPEPR